LKLTKVPKFNTVPQDDNLIQTQQCQKDSDTNSLAESTQLDEVTHCPMNDDGKQHIVSIKQ